MPELDELPASAELTELLRQVITANEPVVVRDREGHPVVALVPWEMFALLRQLLAESLPPSSEALSPEEEQQVQEFAAAMRARGVVAKADPNSPAAKHQSDPVWQQRWDDLLTKFRGVYPPRTPPEEIEADIAAAAEEARQERLAGRR
jgi:hypothetical protein